MNEMLKFCCSNFEGSYRVVLAISLGLIQEL